MKRKFHAFAVALILCLTTTANLAHATTFDTPPIGIREYIVQVAAETSSSTPSITLTWSDANGGTEYEIYRRLPNDGSSWGEVIAVVSGEFSYIDTDVSIGTAYEYRVREDSNSGEGYVLSGIQVPLVDDRGKVVLIVDETIADDLASEISTLENDLVADGWEVLRHDVARDDSVASVRSLIEADYDADPDNVKSVFLLGHVPVPYSGEINPDGHEDHLGAWPADVYYGDINNDNWTDSTVSTTDPADSRNDNVPGDGKFDQSAHSTTVPLSVGRVDMYDLPAFDPDTEIDLLRQYLERNHSYRVKSFTPDTQAFILDNIFDSNSSDRFSQSVWSGFPTVVGPENIATSSSGQYFSTLSADSYLWTYGNGFGTYTSAVGIGDTDDFAENSFYGTFNFLFGSYFGDWDSTDNFLRAPLAADGYALTSAWSGAPSWFVHHMGLGETIGRSTIATQSTEPGDNTLGFQYKNYGVDHTLSVHAALMGDPTLRLNMITPPSSFQVVDAGEEAQLSWTESPDEGVLGYHIYRSTSTDSGFVRISDSLINDDEYTDDSLELDDSYTYMVRAVKLETTSSGSYYNSSNGVMDTENITITPVAPTLSTSEPTAVEKVAATLNGSIVSRGNQNATQRGFFYGLTNDYGASTTESGNFGNGAFSAAIASLSCGTTYHFKAWASSPSAGMGESAPATFETAACTNSSSRGSGGGGSGGSNSDNTKNDQKPPAPTTPDTTEDTPEALMARISELIQLINSLRAQLGLQAGNAQPSDTAQSEQNFVFTRDLTLGSRGEDVRFLQKYLNDQGWLVALTGPGSPGQETSYFGPATRDALARFQASNNIIPAAGYFGAITRNFYRSASFML